MTRGFRVIEPGPLASLQDDGRPGYARVGLSQGGAADRGSWRLANRMVGNDEEAAAVEITLGPYRAIALIPLLACVTGALGRLTLDGLPRERGAVLSWRPGQVLEIEPPTSGVRSYLAVRGGCTATAVLGSRSWHVLARVGPPPLRAGDLVTVGAEPAGQPLVDHHPLPQPGPGPVRLRARWGPREDHFTARSRKLMTEATWRVSDALDRSGVRLSGPVLARHTPGLELPSEGMVRGAIQVPPSGAPILFLADHPATGGYPVIAVLDDPSVDRAAQVRPGDMVTVAVTP